MSDSRALSDAAIENRERSLQQDIPETTVWKDFLALIKIGIVNSNLITTFTGLWLALHFSGKGFFNNLDLVLYTVIGSSLIIAGSCSLNNYIDRDIDPLMERTKREANCYRESEPGQGGTFELSAYWPWYGLFNVYNSNSSCNWINWCFQLCCLIYNVDETQVCFQYDCRQHFRGSSTFDWMGSCGWQS